MDWDVIKTALGATSLFKEIGEKFGAATDEMERACRARFGTRRVLLDWSGNTMILWRGDCIVVLDVAKSNVRELRSCPLHVRSDIIRSADILAEVIEGK